MPRELVRFELNPGESQLWAGRPRQGIVLLPTDLLVVPFGLVWTGAALFITSAFARSNGPAFLRLAGVPFVLIGLYFTFGRLLADAWRRRGAVYVITTDRVILSRSSNSTSLPLASLGDASLVESADGTGNISFGVPARAATLVAGTPTIGAPKLPMLEFVPDARQVFTKLQEAQRLARAREGVATVRDPSAPAAAAIAPALRATRPAFMRVAFLLMFGGVGGFFAYRGATDWYTGLQSGHWPWVSGTVLDSRMTTRRGTSRNGALQYTAEVSYTYGVGGRSYVGNRIAFGSLSVGNGRRGAQQLLRRYRAGSTVKVHYDAAQPDHSVLEGGWTWGSVVMAMLGAVFVVVGVGVYRMMGGR